MTDCDKEDAGSEIKINFGQWVRKIAVELGMDESCDYGLETLIYQIKKLKKRPDLSKKEAAALVCMNNKCGSCEYFKPNECAVVIKFGTFSPGVVYSQVMEKLHAYIEL